MVEQGTSGKCPEIAPPVNHLPLSVVVLAKNEEENLPRCLSALSFTNDVLVIDDFSNDQTSLVAEQCGARVLKHRFTSFADQRNWGQENGGVKYNWVLHLDADEVVTSALVKEISSKLSECTTDSAGFYLCFKTMFMEKWVRRSATFPVWILRLVNRHRVRFLARGHGEAYEYHGSLGYVREPFLHYNFSKGLTHWFDKHNRYSMIEARSCVQEFGRNGIKWRELFAGDPVRRRKELKRLSFRFPFRPWLKFLYMYVLRMGFLDGFPGLTYCTLQAIYEYMICLKIKEIRRGSV